MNDWPSTTYRKPKEGQTRRGQERCRKVQKKKPGSNQSQNHWKTGLRTWLPVAEAR